MKLKSTGTDQGTLVGAVVISMFIWGFSWPSSKILSGYTDPSTLAFIRFVCVVVALLPAVILLKSSLRIHRQGLLILGLGAVFLAIYNYLFLRGLQLGTAGAGGVMVSTLNPIFAYTINVIATRRSPTRNESIGLVFGLIAGIFLVKVWTSVDELLASGNVYFLGAAFLWAFVSKTTSTSSKYGSSLGFSLWLYLATTALMFVFIDANEAYAVIVTADGRFWLHMVVIAFMATTVATTLYFYATSKLGAERASSFIFLVPVSAALSAWVVLGEIPEWSTVIGGIFGIIAVVMINRK